MWWADKKVLFTTICLGRVYHPGPPLVGGIGLITDKLAMLWTDQQRFRYKDGVPNIFLSKSVKCKNLRFFEIKNKFVSKI